MTSAIVNLTEENNRILNIIKAHLGFRNKSDAINYIVMEYAREDMEPPLRQSYIRKMEKIRKEKGRTYRSLAEMMGEYK